jgi:hypothetical protein
MIDGALAFAPLMRRWIGNELDRVPVSPGVHYIAHRDSLVPPDCVADHFRRVHELQLAAPRHRSDYFGIDLREPPALLSAPERERLFDPQIAAAAFRTAEIAIDPEALAAIVRARLAADPNIRLHTATEVRSVARDTDSAAVTVADRDGTRTERYDHVINALWQDRLAIDATAGIMPPRRWLFRYRFILRLRTAADPGIPCVTVVLGPFGDVVNYRTGEFFLSWYRVGMQYATADIKPPDQALAASDMAGLRAGTYRALARIVPSLARIPNDAVETAAVKGGYVFAWGTGDIDDPHSQLHQRSAIGPHSFGNYHTVDTGKYTMIPLFAKQLADRIRGSA